MSTVCDELLHLQRSGRPWPQSQKLPPARREDCLSIAPSFEFVTSRIALSETRIDAPFFNPTTLKPKDFGSFV
jgi:hypothetical protein